jgi:hypothetical protein
VLDPWYAVGACIPSPSPIFVRARDSKLDSQMSTQRRMPNKHGTVDVAKIVDHRGAQTTVHPTRAIRSGTHYGLAGSLLGPGKSRPLLDSSGLPRQHPGSIPKVWACACREGSVTAPLNFPSILALNILVPLVVLPPVSHSPRNPANCNSHRYLHSFRYVLEVQWFNVLASVAPTASRKLVGQCKTGSLRYACSLSIGSTVLIVRLLLSISSSLSY